MTTSDGGTVEPGEVRVNVRAGQGSQGDLAGEPGRDLGGDARVHARGEPHGREISDVLLTHRVDLDHTADHGISCLDRP